MKDDHCPRTVCSAPPADRTRAKGRRAAHLWLAGTWIAGLSLIAGCRSGSGGGDDDGGGGPGDQGDRFHVFLNDPLGGSLGLVDPQNPSGAFPVAGSTGLPFGFNPVFSGTPDLATGVLEEAQVERLIFKSGNRVVDLPLAIGSGATELREIVDLGDALGDLHLGVDRSGPAKTVLFAVEVGGGTYEAFEQTNGVATAAVPFPGTPVSPLVDRATLAMTGWLALDGGWLTRVARDMMAVNLTPATEASFVDVTAGGASFVFLTDRFVVVESSGQVTDVTFTPVAAGSFTLDEFPVVGEDALYFASPTGAQSYELVRALPDGSAAAITGDLMGTPTFLNVIGDRVVTAFETGGGTFDVQSYGVDGSDEVSLETGASEVDLSLSFTPGAGGTRIAYGLAGTSVVDVRADGTDRVVYANSSLVGSRFTDRITFGNALLVDSLFLTSPDVGGGLTIQSVTPGSPGTLRTIGIVPAGFIGVSAQAFFTDTAILTATSAAQADVFVFDPDQAGSLRRVTDTPNDFELGVL